jgi:two-component system response regulator YesN
MFTAMIVDDEKKICNLIRYLGDWEELGIEVIATCQDGEEALLCISRNNPDIVLTDI